MIRTQVQLTEEQFRKLKRVAAERRVSMATLVREAVDRSFTQDDRARRRARAIAVVGKFRSGERDVGRNHDRYLADAFAE